MDYSLVAQKLRDIQAMTRHIDQEAAMSHMALTKEKPIVGRVAAMRLVAEDLLNALDELAKDQ